MNSGNGRENCRGRKCQLLEQHCSMELCLGANVL